METKFTIRHIGPTPGELQQMLQELEVSSFDELIERIVPQDILFQGDLDIPKGVNEHIALRQLAEYFSETPKLKPLLGQGYYDCFIPPVILRNILENPGWYTSYTPYQSEISQGRLELLFYFQTLVTELSGLPVANASLLDEATAIAEAIGVAFRHHREKRNKVIIANTLHPQNQQVIETRCKHLGITLIDNCSAIDESIAAVVIQSPDTFGAISDFSKEIEQAKKVGTLIIVDADPMALLLTKAPASYGTDIVVGSMQRYGVPMGNGGPYAAFMAVSQKLQRLIPGRLVGQSIDSANNVAYRLSLQTREQHIRREKATSNICTAQALLANISAAFAIWHGAVGLINIATKIHQMAVDFVAKLCQHSQYKIVNHTFFDTITIKVDNADEILSRAEELGYLFRKIDNKTISLSFDETCKDKTLNNLARIFVFADNNYATATPLLSSQSRGKEFLSQEIFHQNRSETAMMRFLRGLVNKDLALDRTMIPLGSCTMKLNAAAEMIPVSWSQVAKTHPFSPEKCQKGYQKMITELAYWLAEITGFHSVSFQPNSGSQGEYAGLLAIRSYLNSKNQQQRNICLIPESAHGTNPASAQMAGMKIIVVQCDSQGNVDIDDLQKKAQEHQENLASLMITYPSTHGVFETEIKKICQIIHDNGGQVYLDGANLNALVGIARPGDIGADVCHMNLHKTFCIPHGGGGPGVGPIGVAKHLEPFLPSHNNEGTRVSSAPYGSASILPISWMYIRMLGSDGLKHATECAILNANYLAKKLEPYFPILYKGEKGFVAHECILDTRIVRDEVGVSVEDIAKRLIDYGFHAPTMSWPVAGTLMVEPTESEPLQELDRFVKAMKGIYQEIESVQKGQWTLENNPLSNAPHTLETVLSDDYQLPYDRNTASVTKIDKYWPPVGRVDNVYGDRQLVCSCPPLDDYK